MMDSKIDTLLWSMYFWSFLFWSCIPCRVFLENLMVQLHQWSRIMLTLHNNRKDHLERVKSFSLLIVFHTVSLRLPLCCFCLLISLVSSPVLKHGSDWWIEPVWIRADLYAMASPSLVKPSFVHELYFKRKLFSWRLECWLLMALICCLYFNIKSLRKYK